MSTINANGSVAKQRGRKALSIDKMALQAEIYRIENSSEPPKTQGALWVAVAAGHWSQSLKDGGLSAATVMNRVKDLGIEVATPKGKRGGEGGDFGRSKGVVPSRRKTRKGMSVENMDAYINKVPERALTDKLYTVAEKAEKGSLKAIIKLNCLSCSGFCPKEVRECSVVACAFHSVRPYQGKNEEVELEDPPAEILLTEDQLVQIS
jgi:hypothetical protein